MSRATVSNSVVQAEQLKLLYAGLPLSIAATCLLATLCVSILWPVVGHERLSAWLGAQLVLCAIRLKQWRGYKTRTHRPPAQHLATFRRTTAMAGVLWGIVAVVCYPDDLPYRVFLAFVIAGVSAGAITSQSADWRTAVTFLLFTAAPLAVQLLRVPSQISVVMGAMVILFVVFIALSARRAYVQIIENVRLRTQADELQMQSALALGQLRNVIDAATRISIIATDLDGTIQVFNRGAERMLGYPAYEVIGKATPVIFHLESEIAKRSQELSTLYGKPVKGFDVLAHNARRNVPEERLWTFVRKDGTQVTVNLIFTGTRDDAGRLIGFLGIASDVTEQQRVERMKNEFISMVSHELRTPLTSLRGAIGLIAGGASGPVTEQMRKLIEIASRNGERLTALINDLLDLDKLEAGQMPVRIERVDLSAIVRQSLETNAGLALNYGVQFHLIEPTASGWVDADPYRLQQVIANLLSNAAKFSPSGSRVDVAILREGNSMRVEVRDQGPGIAENFRSRLFQKFSQADSSDTRGKGGTGLGLAVSKAIMEAMNGRIGCNSNAGRGSTFYFELPVAIAPAAQPTPAANADTA